MASVWLPVAPEQNCIKKRKIVKNASLINLSMHLINIMLDYNDGGNFTVFMELVGLVAGIGINQIIIQINA